MRFQFPLLAVISFALSALAQDQVSSAGYKNEVLTQHNKNRADYGAGPLTWSDALYPETLAWAASCVFQHSGGNYGENLYAATGSYGADTVTEEMIAQAIKAWMSEVAQYDFSNPGYSDATGHFTQVVWKATTQVACAEAACPAGTIFSSLPSKYVVCRYSPPGNVLGQFPQNVGRHV